MAASRVAYSSVNAGASTFFIRPGYDSPAAVAGNTLMIGVWLDGTTTITTPAGWNLAASNAVSSGKFALYWRTADGTDTDNPQINFGNYSGVRAVVGVYEEWQGITAYETASLGAKSDVIASSQTQAIGTQGPGRLTWWFGGAYTGGISFASGPVANVSDDKTVQSVLSYVVGDGISAASPATQQVAISSADYSFLGGIAFVSNLPPNAPTPLSPIGGASVDRSQSVTLSAQFSDPDPGDSPSASQWRYRVVGAATWTTVSQPNPLQTYAIPAGLAAGGYEWQAAYADQQGVWGPFCSSEFFTAVDPLPGPVWLDPAAGATIGTDSYAFVFSAPDVDESEFTLYADDGTGNIDTSTILHGPVTVTTGDVRRHTFTGLVNNVPVWASVRYKYQGLWSQPVQQRNPVSYTPPASPVVALSVDNPNGALIVSIQNPVPGAGEPAASYNSVRIDDGDGKGLKHRIGSQMLALNTPYTYRLAVVGRDYTGHVEVTTTAENGTTSTTTA